MFFFPCVGRRITMPANGSVFAGGMSIGGGSIGELNAGGFGVGNSVGAGQLNSNKISGDNIVMSLSRNSLMSMSFGGGDVNDADVVLLVLVVMVSQLSRNPIWVLS